MGTGGTGPCLLGPRGLWAGLAGLGKQESLVGKAQAVKDLPCLPRFVPGGGGTEDGALRDTGDPRSAGINGARPAVFVLAPGACEAGREKPRLPFGRP